MRSRLVLCSLAGALVFAGCLDRKKAGPDAAAPGGDGAPSGAEVPAVVPTLDGAAPDTRAADRASDPSFRDTTDLPLPGAGGAGGAGMDGATEAGGVPGLGGSSGITGGAPGSGGAVGAGGIVATGGVVGTGGRTGTGGIVGTGGVVGTGGAVGTGGTTTCQVKPRDCTSSLDNNCNGTPDNQEATYCTCVVGNSQACEEHPGYDGKGICKAGSQTCAVSTDKTTSSWGACTPGVGPSTRNCTSSADNDCNGTADNLETAYCQCTAGATRSCTPAGMCTAGSQTCVASSDKTTTAWGSCTEYTGPITMYRDSDGDGYGNPSVSAQVCPGTAGYVSNAEDCDDANGDLYPGVSICSTAVQKKSCLGTTPVLQSCDQGCFDGNCRTDGTVGLPGYVTCWSVGGPRCSTSDGCYADTGACGIGPDLPGTVRCDGPNDCNTGESCCVRYMRGGAEALCKSGTCAGPNYGEYQSCDPLANTCTCTLTDVNGAQLYLCS